MLANLAVACRPHGAPAWHHAGIMAALEKVAHISLADVMAAVARAASDRTAENPGVISATNSLHWREKVADRTPTVAPKRDEQCHTCGRHLDSCICGERATSPARPSTDPTTWLQTCRAAVRGEKEA